MVPSVRKIPLWFLGFLILGFTNISCLKSTKPGIPPDVLKVLNETGFNRIELTKTIAGYIGTTDTLKLKGAYFLISNMHRQYYVDFKVYDSNNNMYEIGPLSFQTDSTFLAYWNALDLITGGLRFKANIFMLDTDTITSSILSSRIDRCLDTITNAYLNHFTRESVFQYVLPYRIANEAIENWQEILLYEYPDLFRSNKSVSSDSMIRLIDDLVEDQFRFDGRFVKQSSVQKTDQLIRLGRGSHEDLAQLKVKMLRTAGIPATIDYTPYLNDSVNGFHWAVAMNSSGVFVPLIPEKCRFLFSKQNTKIPKIYRRVYAIQPNSLFRSKDISFYTPPFLGHYDYLDVTREYFDVVQLQVKTTQSDTVIYVTVFNDGNWKAIDHAYAGNKGYWFYNLRSAIEYRPAVFRNDSLMLLNQASGVFQKSKSAYNYDDAGFR